MQGVLGLENHMLFLQEDSAIYQKHFYYITAFLHERLCTDFTMLNFVAFCKGMIILSGTSAPANSKA